MTQPNYTHISFLLDRSGSMQAIWDDARGGFAEFIKSQKAAPGKATFSFSVFDSEYTPVRVFSDIQDVPENIPDTITPRAMTALLDGIGRLVSETGHHLSLIPEQDRPSKVVVVIYTDGQENASREFTYESLKTLIEQQETVYSWDFIFLASNLDAKATATSFGVRDVTRAANVNVNNLAYASALTGEKLATYRTTGLKTDLSYSIEEQSMLAQDPQTDNKA